MYYQNESDETLVMLTLAGEQTAYEALVIRYQNAVMASATAPHGWEWFDSVRDEERFKACVDRVGRIVGLW